MASVCLKEHEDFYLSEVKFDLVADCRGKKEMFEEEVRSMVGDKQKKNVIIARRVSHQVEYASTERERTQQEDRSNNTLILSRRGKSLLTYTGTIKITSCTSVVVIVEVAVELRKNVTRKQV